MIAYEKIGVTSRRFRQGWRFVWAQYSNEDKQNDHNESLSISFFRGTFQADKLVQDSVDYWNDVTRGIARTRSRRYCVHKVFGEGGRFRNTSDAPFASIEF